MRIVECWGLRRVRRFGALMETRLWIAMILVFLAGCGAAPSGLPNLPPLPEPVATSGPLSDNVVRALHLCIDDSGSMAGYARGDGCFDRLWLDAIDRAQAELGVAKVRTWLVGRTVRKGPAFFRLKRFASEHMYSQPKTVIRDLLGSTEVFPAEDEGVVVAFVSDLEPDVASPEPECAGNGSVVCLVKAFRRLQGEGWFLGVVGFPSAFRGKRYYPKFLPDGTVNTNAFHQLDGEEVPVYVLVAAPERGLVWRFAEALKQTMGACGSNARVLDLGEPVSPQIELMVREGLEHLTSSRGGGRKPIKTGGLLAYDPEKRDARVRIENFAHTVVMPVRFRMRFEPQATWQPGVRWELTAEVATHGTGISPGGVAVRLVPSEPVRPTQEPLDGRVEIAVSRSCLKRMTRAGFVVDVVIRGRPRVVGTPWADWAYEFAGDPGYEVKTFRTSNVFCEVLKSAAERADPSVLASLRIRLLK